jgi:para-aminobenzoate synthetase
MSSFGIIYVDAYDSFSNNIIALLVQFATVTVVKIDDEVADLEGLLTQCAAVVIGPGPGHPENPKDIGLIPSVLSVATKLNVPVLGICLGFQVLCSSSGLHIIRHAVPYHGRSKMIWHSAEDIFRNVGVVLATCYNSLGVHVNEIDTDANSSRPGSSGSNNSNSTDTAGTSPGPKKASPSDLICLAHDGEGYIMACKHRALPQWGVQFHPESCKSNLACYNILKNWWALVLIWNAHWQRCKEPWQQATIAHKVVPRTNHCTLKQAGKHFKHDALIHLLSLTTAVGTKINSRRLQDEVSAEDLSQACYSTWPNRNTVMLESIEKGRFSIYALHSPSAFTLQHRGGVLHASRVGIELAAWSLTAQDCLYVVEKLVSHRKISACHCGDHCVSSPFWGGFLGFISYEYGLDLLDVDQSKGQPQPPLTPGLALLWADRSIIVDHVDHTTTVQSIRRDDDEWIAATANSIQSGDFKRTERPGHSAMFEKALQNARHSHPDELDYKSRIGKCLQHLRAGNSYELCLTTEAQVRLKANKDRSFQLYQNLRRHNPVPFAAYVSLGGTVIVSSSPEQFLTWDRQGDINMIPMKGTVRKTPTMTFEHAASILASPKEQAENLMIADLIRHDLHSALGSQATVTVEKLCVVEEFATVYQLVSHIRAAAPLSVSISDASRRNGIIRYGHSVLRHALPPGSMTGAPKKRSCEILSELEKRERGAYSGVIGYFDVGGGGSWSVCIRSAFTNASEDADGLQTWRIGAGGAITVLSDPQAEWEEMQTKLQSVMKAFEPANKPEY